MKRLFSLLVALAVLFSLAACGNKTQPDTNPDDSGGDTMPNQEENAGTVDDTVYELKAGTVLAADSIGAGALQHWSDYVKEATDGHVIINVFPGGQLGNEKEIYEGMMLGSADISFCGTAALTSWVPKYMMFDLPLLFTSMEQFNKWAASDDPTVRAMVDELNSVGIKNYGFVNIGFYHVISNKMPFNDVSKVTGMNVRTLESNAIMALYSNAGANPVSMTFSDVYTSLQNGTVDAAAFPDATTNTSQFFQVVEYLTLLNTAPTCCPIAISQKTLDKLPEEYRTAIEEGAKSTIQWCLDNYDKFEDDALKVISEGGVTIIDPTEAEVQAWQDKVCQVTYDQYIPSTIDQATIDYVLSCA